jgi:hypothetical protein
MTTPQVFLPYPTCRVRVSIYCGLTPGTGATAVTPKLYVGSTITGTKKSTDLALACIAGSPIQVGYDFEEFLSGLSSVQYTLSLTMTGATGNSTVAYASSWIDLFA